MNKLLPLILCPLITYGASSEDITSTPKTHGVKRDRSEYATDLQYPTAPQAIARPKPIVPRLAIPDVSELNISMASLAISEPSGSPYGFRGRVADAMQRGVFERIIFKAITDKK